jgi:hypothetical protein
MRSCDAGMKHLQVVGPEQATERTSLDAVHSSGFQIYQDSSGNILATGSFVKVDVDSIQLGIGCTLPASIGLDTVFVGKNFPEFGTDLVTTLTGLEVDDFSHLDGAGKRLSGGRVLKKMARNQPTLSVEKRRVERLTAVDN